MIRSHADQPQTGRRLSHHQIRLHPPIRPGDRDLHLHEPDQWGDHLCDRATRSYFWYHWGQQEGTGNYRTGIMVEDHVVILINSLFRLLE